MKWLVVVVAHNNNDTLEATLSALAAQLEGDERVVVIDNASTCPLADQRGLAPYRAWLHRSDSNLGFCGGNNLGLRLGDWRQAEAVLLLNPDLLLPAGWLARARDLLRQEQDRGRMGLLSGPLVRYDFAGGRPLPLIDSLGIARQWPLGWWGDIGRGRPAAELSARLRTSPPAICGALMLLPTTALLAVAPEGQLFDERFGSSKEDIDLSLRLRRLGLRLVIAPALLAWHGRGWTGYRAGTLYALRLQSARNEVLLHIRHVSPFLLMSLLKWLYVRFCERRGIRK